LLQANSEDDLGNTKVMHLDLPSLMAMQSFVAACAGAVLLIAWIQNHKLVALALWGLSDLFAAAGIFLLMLGSALHQPVWSAVAGALLVLAPGLVWMAARTFDARLAPLGIALIGVLLVGIAGAMPILHNITGSFGLVASAVYLLAAATTIRVGRREDLPARLPLMILLAIHASTLLLGAFATIDGSRDRHELPPLLSLFGLIHFESIIFAVGTAAFVLALVKERSEFLSRIAANTDPLTGIANRASFMESASRVLERSMRDGAPVSVMMFDLDRFKTINDTHGHAIGDAVIRKFCEVTSAGLRPTDVFGRIGGEEFAVALAGASIEVALVRADRIRVAFADSCKQVSGCQVNATVSCGVSISHHDGETHNGETLDRLLGQSDIALYCAKSEGRNRVQRANQSHLKGDPPTVIRIA
jgi:diguanylate cyclase (GGDEF)-like protein